MKTRMFSVGILCLSFLIFFPGKGPTATYYVDESHPSASDSNPGTEEFPWLTLEHAAENVVPGDTVMVMSGTYEGVTFTESGSNGAPITFLGELTASVIIQGGMEFATGVAYMSVANFTIRDHFVWGVFLRGSNRYINLRGFNVSGGDNGFHLTWGYQGEDPLDGPVSDIVIENSLVEDCLYTGVDCTPGPCDRVTVRNVEVRGMGIEAAWGADGIAFERGEYITVEDCYVHDNAGDGIDLNSRDHDGYVSGIIVRRNRVVRNHMTGIKLWGGGRIENNVIWGQGNNPVDLGTFPGTYDVINNTIAFNMWDPDFGVRNYAFVVAYPDGGPSAQVDLTLLNNIFAFNCNDDHGGPTGLYLGEGVTLVSEGYNLYWSRNDGEIQAEFVQGDSWFTRAEIADGTWTAATGQGDGNVSSDPSFISAWPSADLHLNEGSPGIDVGVAMAGLFIDLEGKPRPSGDGYDIGAYEYQSSTGRPEADFNGASRNGQGDTCSVQFTDQSSGSITSWTWNFGDSGTSEQPNPSHTYRCNGSYTVSLTVSGPGGSDTETKVNYISCNCPCQILLTAPGEDEIWCAGERESITWMSENTGGNVTIEYSTNQGSEWHSVALTTPDEGTYSWIVPGTSSAECRLKICDVSDPTCCDTSQSVFRICECEKLEISAVSLPNGTEDCPYNQMFHAVGGCPPFSWSVTDGQLPTGLSLDGSSGTVTGEPTGLGDFEFTVTVRDMLQSTDEQRYSLEVVEYVNRKGDVNADCTLDILDVAMVVNIILGTVQPTPGQHWCADCNGSLNNCHGDGVVNVLDAMKIVGLILGTDTCP